MKLQRLKPHRTLSLKDFTILRGLELPAQLRATVLASSRLVEKTRRGQMKTEQLDTHSFRYYSRRRRIIAIRVSGLGSTKASRRFHRFSWRVVTGRIIMSVSMAPIRGGGRRDASNAKHLKHRRPGETVTSARCCGSLNRIPRHLPVEPNRTQGEPSWKRRLEYPRDAREQAGPVMHNLSRVKGRAEHRVFVAARCNQSTPAYSCELSSNKN